MRTTLLAMALLMSGTAIAQTQPESEADPAETVTESTADPTMTDGSGTATTTESMPVHSTQTAAVPVTAPASGPVVQPGNQNPERDARGIAVMSAPAVVPAGFNGVTGAAVGGPLVDPSTGQTVSGTDSDYPACSATITDNCLQTYERGRG